MATIPQWMSAGRGKQPQLRWSFVTNTPLKYLSLARETGELLASDEAGKLYLLNRQGELLSSMGGFSSLRGLAFSENGQAATAIMGDTKLIWLNRKGSIVGTKDFSAGILSIAMDPYGNLVAVTLDNGSTSIFQGKRDRIAHFQTDRPLSYLRFLATEPLLMGASEYGMIGLYDLQGDEIWKQNFSTNVGDMAVSGDGTQIYLAGFNLGVQRYDVNGDKDGSIVVEGNPRIIETSYETDRLAVTTLENHLYWLNDDGKVIWEATPPAEICNLCCDPLGHWLICGLTTGEIYSFDWRDW